jgi:hypothetical protein
MILETTKGDGSDILIYSENRFDLQNNFRMIRHNIWIKTPIRLHYNDVCSFLNDLQPKTIVAYRLLTNLDDFDLNYVKYGQPVLVNGQKEVIYFDPIYCVKEMEDNGFLNDDPDLRFRIQQIGLKFHGHKDDLANLEESYCFDLEASEVQNQNDRSFAELICAFDEIDFDKVINLSTNEIFDSPKPEQPKPEPKKTKFQALSSDDLSFEKKGSGSSRVSTTERKGLVTLAWSRKTGGLFEEDDNYDPSQANKRVNMEEQSLNNSLPNTNPASSDQQNARFQVVGQGRKKSPFQSTQVLGRNQSNVEREKNKSLFSSFLEKKRQEVAANLNNDQGRYEEITDSMKEFATDREKRFVVLKLRKDDKKQ